MLTKRRRLLTTDDPDPPSSANADDSMSLVWTPDGYRVKGAISETRKDEKPAVNFPEGAPSYWTPLIGKVLVVTQPANTPPHLWQPGKKLKRRVNGRQKAKADTQLDKSGEDKTKASGRCEVGEKAMSTSAGKSNGSTFNIPAQAVSETTLGVASASSSLPSSSQERKNTKTKKRKRTLSVNSLQEDPQGAVTKRGSTAGISPTVKLGKNTSKTLAVGQMSTGRLKKKEKRSSCDSTKDLPTSEATEIRTGVMLKNGVKKAVPSSKGSVRDRKKMERKSSAAKIGATPEKAKCKREKKKKKKKIVAMPPYLPVDLLRQVASHLAASPALFTFRALSRTCFDLAEEQLKKKIDTVHLDEFLPENPFSPASSRCVWNAPDCPHRRLAAFLQMSAIRGRRFTQLIGRLPPALPSCALPRSVILTHRFVNWPVAALCGSGGAGGGRKKNQLTNHNISKSSSKGIDLSGCEPSQEFISKLAFALPPSLEELRLTMAEPVKAADFSARQLAHLSQLRSLELNFPAFGPAVSDKNLPLRHILTFLTFKLPLLLPDNGDQGLPITSCFPCLRDLSVSATTHKLFLQLRERGPLSKLRFLRIGSLDSAGLRLLAPVETLNKCLSREKVRVFGLEKVAGSSLERMALRLTSGWSTGTAPLALRRIIESIHQLPGSLRIFDVSYFHRATVAISPFQIRTSEMQKKGGHINRTASPHLRLQELRLHFDGAISLAGLSRLLPLTLERIAVSVVYNDEEESAYIATLYNFLADLDDWEDLDELQVKVTGVCALERLLTLLAERLRHLHTLSIDALPSFANREKSKVESLLVNALSEMRRVHSLQLGAPLLRLLLPSEEHTKNGNWRDGIVEVEKRLKELVKERNPSASTNFVLTVAEDLPRLYDGEQYASPDGCYVDSPPELEEAEECDDEAEMFGDESFFSDDDDDDDDILQDDNEEPEMEEGEDELEVMDAKLHDETEKLEERFAKKDRRRVRKITETSGEDSTDVVDWDTMTDDEEEKTKAVAEATRTKRKKLKAAHFFVDDEAEEVSGSEGEAEEEEVEEDGEAGDALSSSDESDQEEDAVSPRRAKAPRNGLIDSDSD